MYTNEERDTLITFIKLLGLFTIVLFILACALLHLGQPCPFICIYAIILKVP